MFSQILYHLPVEQVIPSNPSGQRHSKELIRSLQVAPFLQGLGEHSFISARF